MIVASVYERRVGHLRTIVVGIGGQFLAGLLTALFLWAFDDSGWPWAVDLGGVRDLGLSAGGFAVLGALSRRDAAGVASPRPRRFGAYLLAMLLTSGLLWDVEHFVAFVIGIVAGPFLAGRRPARPTLTFNQRTQRALVALVIAVTAIAGLIESVYPGQRWTVPCCPRPRSRDVLRAVAHPDRQRRVAPRPRRRTATRSARRLGVHHRHHGVRPRGGARCRIERRAHGATRPRRRPAAPAAAHRPGRSPPVARSHVFRRAGRRLLWVALGLFVYTAVGFAVLKDEFVPAARPADMITEFLYRLVFSTSGNIEPATTSSRVFVNSIGAVWYLAIIVTIIGIVYSSRRPRPVPEADVRLRQMLRTWPSSNIEWMLTWKDITVWISDDGETAIGYEVIGTIALCLADPVGPPDRREAALREFDDYCFHSRLDPVPLRRRCRTRRPSHRHSAGSRSRSPRTAWWCSTGWSSSGKAFQDVRTAINRAGKQRRHHGGHPLAGLDTGRDRPVAVDQRRLGLRQGAARDGLHARHVARSRRSRGAPAPRGRCRSDDRGVHVVDARGRPTARSSDGHST